MSIAAIKAEIEQAITERTFDLNTLKEARNDYEESRKRVHLLQAKLRRAEKTEKTKKTAKTAKTEEKKLYERKDLRVLPVPKTKKERVIKDFITLKGLKFEEGRAYYEFTKQEKIAPDKDIVAMHKESGQILGGPAVRSLLGMTGTNYTVTLTPPMDKEYDFFIRSDSNNRKLVAGTRVLYKIG